jgi:glycosyltransferase involved in cell wall biosynthesis
MFESMIKPTKYKVAHLSSAHNDMDVRIFHKECSTLANLGMENSIDFEVHLVLNGVQERVENNVTIHSVAPCAGRLKRMWKTVNEVYQKAKEIDADVYHLHDPELLRVALKLKRAGKKVIYDAHEDLPRQILGKDYLKFKNTISQIVEKYENRVARRLDAVITATPFIRDRFLKINPNTIDINNFPLLSEVDMSDKIQEKQNKICFIGGISRIRGIAELVQSLEFVDIQCDIAGKFPDDFKEELMKEKGWGNVEELGFIDRSTSLKVKSESLAGVVTFLALPNHVNAQPNKIFEYMAAGIPVIGSNFQLWKEIIENNDCGICVDPTKPKEIAKAIEFIQENPMKAKEMGKRGRKKVLDKYNWQPEGIKLVSVYNNLF